MAKKKKKEVETGRILGRLNDDGTITPFIQKQQEEDIAPVKNDNKWFKNGIDTSGYDIQNPLDAINRINAGILMTGVDALGQFGKGFLGSAEGVTDLAKTTTADVLDFFGADNKAKKLRESAERTWGVNEQLEQALASDNGTGIDDMSFLGEKGKTVPQGLGTTMFSMTTGGLGGALLGTTAGASATSMALLGMSAAGNSEQEAIKEMKANQKINGLSDKEIYKNAKLYGVLSGIIETGTEMMFGAAAQGSQLLGIGTGAFDEADDAVINALTKKISNKMIKTFAQAGLKATSEGVEEVASGFLNAWAKKLTYMKQEDINKLIEDENLLDSFLSGTFSAALSQAPSVVNNITTTENGKLKLRNNNEIRDFLTNLNEQEQQVVEQEIQDRINEEGKITKKRRIEIEKQVIEDLDRGYINANTIRDVLGENYNAERDVRLNESFNEEARRTQAYQNDLSKYDEKQRKTIQAAIDSGLLNNSNKTHDMVDLIARLSADKGIDFDFTNNQRIKESGFAVDGKQINGFIKDGKVTLNLESNQVLNKTVGHEITHVLEGTDLYKSLQDSLKSFIGEREWNNRISQLEKDYKNVKGANIENELTSDLVGEYVFNDESFVKSLSTKNPNLFQKIFDEIKYMVKIATAGSKEARDLEKVKRAFEKAYRETSKTQQGTQYQLDEVQKTSDLNEYVADAAVRDAQKLEKDRQTIKDAIQEHLEEEGITNPTREDMLNAFDTYELMDASDEFNDYRKAEKFISDVVDEMLQDNTQTTTKDSLGREISKEQQEYFKDSKIRDDNGNLKVIYHGTPNDFTIFDTKNFGGANGTAEGFGIYLTDNIEVADDYLQQDKGKVMELYANITKPATTTELTTTKQDIIKAIKELTLKDAQEMVNDGDYDNINDALKDTWISNYTYTYDKTLEQAYNDVANTILEGSENDFEVLQELMNGSGNNDYSSAEDFYKVITDTLGFDGIQTKWDFKDNDLKQKNANIYIAFNSNQVKNIDNTNPTNSPDIRYQLGNNEVAPTSGWNVRSEDVRLQSAFKDAIAPLQEQVQELTKTIQNIVPSRALTEEEANEYAAQTQEAFNNEVAPIRENLTPEENQRLDMLELLERNNMMNEERRYEKEQLENKINPVYPTEEATPGQALSDIRDIDEVGKRDVKAYQYEHPEVKPYFQEEARGMLNDLRNSQKGERIITEGQQRGQGTYYDVIANKRFTSPEIAELLDSKWGYTYSDIEKGLNAIIEDHGAENIAVAKRIEFTLDDNLRNGYTDWQTGMEIPPNQDYLNMLREQEWNNYFDNLNEQYPLEQLQEPQYNLEDEETDFSDVSIEPDLSNFTADDIDVSPFLEGLQGASKRQAERQQQREELNQKKEVKIPKQSDGKRALNRGLGLLVNEFAVVDDYSKQTGNKNIKFKADTYNNYQAIAQSNIETAQTDINGKAIGPAGISTFEEAKRLGLSDIYDKYLKLWANVDKGKQGKGTVEYTPKEAYMEVKKIEAKYPVLKKLGKTHWQYFRNARHNLVEAGVISKELSDLLGRMYAHYTPYISENADNYFTKTGELKPKATIKRAKGGAIMDELLSAEEAMKIYTKSEFNTIFGNDLYREIVNTSNDIVQLGGDDRGMQFVNADNLYADKNGYYLTAYENGNPITAKISEDMYRTLSRESRNRISDIENTFSAVTKPLQAASNIRRNILTSWSPTFIAKNFIKDFQEGIFNSKYTKDFIKNYPTAFKELATNTELAQQFKSLYGSGLTMGQFDIDSNNYNPSGKNRNFLKGIKNANELIELAPRFAEFKASRQNGASIQEAMYNAREVTTNFSRGGTLAKALNRNGFTFLNSSIQGFDKFVRNFSGENGAKGVVNSLAKAVIFGIAPAVFNELAFGSGDDKDEEYEALPDYIKDNYYIIKTSDGNFVRIPKGRVLSVFGSAARRTIEAMEGEENAFEGYWNNVQQQIGINNPEENNIFAPLIQAMGGRKLDSGQTAGSAWYGGDIIPTRLQKERPEDQYDASIDKFSIWLGQKTGISPYKINYVLDQYTGGIGDLAIPMMTEEANSDGSIIAPIKDQFTADSTTDNKYVSEFYDTYNKIYTGSKKTDEDVLQKNYMTNISKQMGELYAERREIQADTTLSKKEKYEKAQAIKAEINRLAKEGLDNYKNISVTGDYADVNGQEYQKADDGWKKLSSNTSDDVNSLGLTNREKNNYIKTQQNISSIKKKYKDTDDYVGKKQDIIGEIINTNLTDDAKMSLYQDTYKDKFSNYATELGFDADTYLEYKAQDFSADKDKNGKSISGSKKRKVFDYVNSMDIPYEQKLLLVKSEYNSFNDNNVEIIEYIENSGMSYDDKMDLYKTLGFKIDGDTISW